MVWHSIRPQSSDNARVTDKEHLAPGGFALSYAFPYWFVRRESDSNASEHFPSKASVQYTKDESSEDEKLPISNLASKSSSDCRPPRAPITTILEYIKTAFDDELILDGLPVEAAANPGAWKAWQAHRRAVSLQARLDNATKDQSSTIPGQPEIPGLTGLVKYPEEWSWDGVWERRVRKGVDASISEQILFGAGGGDEIVGLRAVSSTSKKLIPAPANPDLTPRPLRINKRKRQVMGQSHNAHASWPTDNLIPAAKVRRAATMSYPPTFLRPQPMRSQSAHDQHEVAHPSQSSRAVTLATIPWSDVSLRFVSSSSHNTPTSSTSTTDQSDRTPDLDCLLDSNSEHTVRRKQPLKHRILSRVMNGLIGKSITRRALADGHGTRNISTEGSTSDECPGTTTYGRPSLSTTERSSSNGINLGTALPEFPEPPVSTLGPPIRLSDSLGIEQQSTVQLYRRLCAPNEISVIQPKVSIIPEIKGINPNQDRSLYVAVEITAVAKTIKGFHGLDVAVIIDNS
ncbi:MAG: hypothetical protein Q9224_003079 [Gallowayella concinna]